MSATRPLTWILLTALAAPACSGARVQSEGRSSDERSDRGVPADGETTAPQPGGGGSTAPDSRAGDAPLLGTRARIPGLAAASARGDETALAALRELTTAADARTAEHAALVLGAVLLDRGEGTAALPHLRRAARGSLAPDHARLLLGRATLTAGDEAARSEARELLVPVAERAATPALGGGARLLLLRLASRAGSWAEAARWGRALLAAPTDAVPLDETRWLTAEALRLSGATPEARDLYRALWHSTPGSPWATRARDQLASLGESTAPRDGERLPWIENLQAAGLHDDALDALTALLAADLPAEKRAHALYLATRSHFVLRNNDRVVARAEELRREQPGSPWAAKGALEAIRALGRGERTADIRARERWLHAEHPTSEAAHEARYYLANHLASRADTETAGVALLRELADGTGVRAPDARWRLAWLAHRRGDSATARGELAALLERHPQTGFRAAALYWQARWSAPANGEAARELYRRVRAEYPRDYYGRLAAERLSALGVALAPLPGGDDPPEIDRLDDPARRPEPAYRRAVDLYGLGLPGLAAEELATVDAGDDEALALSRVWLRARSGDTWSAIAELSSRWGDALRREPLGSPGVPAEVWQALYPFPYRRALEAAVARRRPDSEPFDSYLLAALARRESRFWPRAVSGAGAVGLMQLMPETATRTARRVGLPAPGRAELFDPETNLELGTALLASHVEEFGGEWAPAIASYNAGEDVVRRWWAGRPPGQPLDEWIEGIPYLETRLYVKAILGDYRNYRELYGADAGGDGAARAQRGGQGQPGAAAGGPSDPRESGQRRQGRR
jgi:soluble lytic murein transglycosylase